MQNGLTEFIPHGICLLWRKDLLFLHVVSDSLITMSYYSIPITLGYFIVKRKDLAFRRVFFLFILFITACGATHAMDIWTIWYPDYIAEGVIKLVTAAASVTTAIVLWRVIPHALSLPTPTRLREANLRFQHEMEERMRAEAQLRQLNADLEQMVEKRTSQLVSANNQLNDEIQDRRRIEQSLRESEQRYRALFEQMPDAVVLKDIESGRLVDFNQKAYEDLGYSLEEFQRLRINDIDRSASADEMKRRIDKTRDEGSYSFETEHITKHGEIRNIRVNAKVVGSDQKKFVQAVWTDISSYKQLEQALRAKQENLEHTQRQMEYVLRTSPAAIYSLVTSGNDIAPFKISFISDAINAITGFEPAAWCNNEAFWIERIHPDDLAGVLVNDKELMKTANVSQQYRIQRNDGSYCWVHDQRRLFRDDLGNIVGVIGACIDITDRKQAEEDLIKSLQFNRAILHIAMDGFLVVNQKGLVVDVNPAFCQLTGYNLDEIINKMSAEAFSAVETPEEIAGRIERIIARGSDHFQISVRHKCGEVIDVDVCANYLPADDDRIFAFVRDITEQRKSERDRFAQMEQQRETVVREVHHRIKNNLQGVIGLLDLYSQDHPDAKEVVSDIIGKIKSVAVVFGLQGQHGADDICLCEITSEICKGAERLTGTVVAPQVEWLRRYPIQVDKNKAVPIALIINELVINALKHGRKTASGEPVLVKVGGDEESAAVTVQNECDAIPSGFDFARGRGIGTGLTLVKSLLPSEGAKLTLSCTNGIMTAELRLSEPIVNILKRQRAV